MGVNYIVWFENNLKKLNVNGFWYIKKLDLFLKVKIFYIQNIQNKMFSDVFVKFSFLFVVVFVIDVQSTF